MGGRGGFLVALAIGELGIASAFLVGVLFPADLQVLAALAFASGVAGGGVTRGAFPFLGFIVGYAGGWAVYFWWRATYMGFRELDFLLISFVFGFVILSAAGFGVGRLVALKASKVRWSAPGSLERLALVGLLAASTVAGFVPASTLKYAFTAGAENIGLAWLVIAVIYTPIVVIAAGAWFIARRTKSRVAGGLAAVAAAFLAGSVGAAIIAPSYEAPRFSAGTLELRIESPFSGAVSGPADCQSIPNGTDFANATANGLTGLGPWFVQVTVSVRGAVSQGGPDRSGPLGLIIVERPPLGEVTVAEGSFGEFVADDSAVLAITTEGAGGHRGSMTFANLRQTKGDGAFGLPSRIVLSGAVSWSCDAPASP